jgi:hypothetical protein
MSLSAVGQTIIGAAVSLLLSLHAYGQAEAQTISVGVNPGTFAALKSALNLSDADPVYIDRHNCPGIKSETLVGAGREVVEPTIVCNALFEAGIADNIELVHHLPHRRRLTEVALGRIDLSGTTIFPEGLANVAGAAEPLISDAVIRINEFEKAVFTLPGRDDVLAVRSLNELRKFSAVTGKFWRVDLKTLNAMKLAGVAAASKPDAFYSMIKGGRADFLISEFSSDTSKSWAKGMVRVPGIKIALVSTRIIPVSPKRMDILQALNSYLEKARSTDGDLITQAFRKSGFLNSDFAEWKLLFPEQ